MPILNLSPFLDDKRFFLPEENGYLCSLIPSISLNTLITFFVQVRGNLSYNCITASLINILYIIYNLFRASVLGSSLTSKYASVRNLLKQKN